MASIFDEPPLNCDRCPRLGEFRHQNREKFPDWHNAPVPAFGDLSARLLIVGLAPGLKGANRTARPFTGDYAGDLLYPTLIEFGWATGQYGGVLDDGLKLEDCRITNAVRCVPPQNKPVGAEEKACRPFLAAEISAMSRLKVILALGGLAHSNLLTLYGVRKKDFPFGHARRSGLDDGVTLVDSYHCSRYNTNTGRLTTAMFHDVFTLIAEIIDH